MADQVQTEEETGVTGPGATGRRPDTGRQLETERQVDPERRVETERQAGPRDVLLVALVLVLATLALELLAGLVPPIGELFDRLPIAIVVLLVGTVWVLWRITRRESIG